MLKWIFFSCYLQSTFSIPQFVDLFLVHPVWFHCNHLSHVLLAFFIDCKFFILINYSWSLGTFDRFQVFFVSTRLQSIETRWLYFRNSQTLTITLSVLLFSSSKFEVETSKQRWRPNTMKLFYFQLIPTKVRCKLISLCRVSLSFFFVFFFFETQQQLNELLDIFTLVVVAVVVDVLRWAAYDFWDWDRKSSRVQACWVFLNQLRSARWFIGARIDELRKLISVNQIHVHHLNLYNFFSHIETVWNYRL